MVVCPVCEHAQDRGGECQVCGRQPTAAVAPDAPVARLAELEPTRHEVAPAPSADRIEDLEPTLREPAPASAPSDEALGWLERTSPRAAEGAPDRDLFAVPVCRYCRSQASPGEVFCARCGLKLPHDARAAPPPSDDVRRCRSCGVAGEGEVCRACGTRFATGT